MGLYADITRDIAKAFNTDLADAVQVQTLTITTTTYATDTGVVTPTEITTETRGVAEPVNNDMVDGEVIQQADTLFTILDAEIDLIPSIGDKITLNGIDYSLNTVLQDPASVTWTLVGRAI